MKNIFLACMLCAGLSLTGCMGQSAYTGLDGRGSFVSNVRPVFQVQPVEGFSPIINGKTLCTAHIEDSMLAGYAAQVAFAIHKSDNARIVTYLSDLGLNNVEWSLSGHGAEYQHRPVFFEEHGVMSEDPDIRVFARPAELDPWTKVSGENPPKTWLVARFDRMFAGNRAKLTVEYAEPLDEPASRVYLYRDEAKAFVQKAEQMFVTERNAGDVQAVKQQTYSIPNNLLSPVVGPVEEPAYVYDFD